MYKTHNEWLKELKKELKMFIESEAPNKRIKKHLLNKLDNWI